MSSKPIDLHPLCSIFPEMDADTFSELKTSMEVDGFKKEVPIILFDGKILDGRNRFNAATAAGRKPVFEKFKGTEAQAKEFVIRANLTRRHLTAPQRSMIAAELAENDGETTESAAKKMGVSKDSVAVAKKIKKKAPEVAKQVKAGKKSLNRAEKEVAPPKKRDGKTGSKEITMDNLSSVYGSGKPAEKPEETKSGKPAEPSKSNGQVAYEAYYEVTEAKDIPDFEGLPTKEIQAWEAAAAAARAN